MKVIILFFCFVIVGCTKNTEQEAAQPAMLAVKPIADAAKNGGMHDDALTNSEKNTRQEPAQPTLRTEQKLNPMVFRGDIISYPAGSSLPQVQDAIPDMNCERSESEEKIKCYSHAALTQASLVQGPILCVIKKEWSVDFSKRAGLDRFSCDIANTTADDLFTLYSTKYGKPSMERKKIMSMVVDDARWETGEDSVNITHLYGSNAYGDPFDSYMFQITASTK